MKRSTKFILFSIYVSFFVVLGALIALFGTPMCLRRECERKAAYIILRMDQEADPCEDFHKFVCGKGAQNATLANVTVSPTGNSETLFSLMSTKVEDYVNRLQSGLDVIKEPIYHETLYYQFSRVCSEMQKGKSDIVLEYVNQALTFSLDGTGMTVRDLFNPKKFNESLTVGIYEYKSRVAGFMGRRIFDSDFRPDYRNPTSIAFYICKPFKNDNLASHVNSQSSPESWGSAYKSVIQSFIPNLDDKTLPSLDTFTDVGRLLIEVSTLRTSNVDDKSMKAMDLNHFESYSDLDLKGYLREIVRDDTKLPTHLYMHCDSMEYFQELKNVFNKYSRYVKILYIVLNNLFDFAPFIGLDSTVTDLVGGAQLSQYCGFLMNSKIGSIASSLIIERFKIKSSGALLLGDIFRNIKSVLGTSMNKLTWMDKPTKIKAALKLQSMISAISLSESEFDSIKSPGKRRHYYDGLCLRNSFVENALCLHDFLTKKEYSLPNRPMTGFETGSEIVYAVQYKRDKNKVYIPFTILRLPAYEDDWPTNVNFGGIATEIGSIIMNGFDYKGSNYGRFGSSDHWWTNTTHKNFEKIYRSCGKFYVSEEGFPEINLEFTRAMGLRLAYKAYVEYKKKNTNKEELLPGLEMYNPRQVFYLSHAHMECESPWDTEEKKESVKNYFNLISSSDEFRDTFGCKAKGPKGAAKEIAKCMLF